MKVLIDLDIFYEEDIRLIKTLIKRESPDEFPELMKWAFQMLYFNGAEWIEICRIDNYLHGNIMGSHIHAYGKEEVKRVDISFQDADDMIKEIGSRILKDKFSKIWDG
jgi:hypothetical protein